MGVFSPVVSVAAALRLNAADYGPQGTGDNYSITNLPARVVELGAEGTKITAPSFSNGTITVLHANQEKIVNGGSEYTYDEVGQYEWRFYTGSASDGKLTASNKLFDTYTVTVTDKSYSMAMPDNVPTVAPKDLTELTLPLPSTFTVGGEEMKIVGFTNDKKEVEGDEIIVNYVVVALKDSRNNETKYRLSANVSLENYPFGDDKIAITEKGLKIDLTTADDDERTGDLKVTYKLSTNSNGGKLLVALPLDDIEIKNIKTSDVTFASIPTAPSVKNLAYWSDVTLTAPSADSAKTANTSFNVEATTRIVQVQASLWSTEPSWSTKNNKKIITLTWDDEKGEWKSSNSKYSADDIFEIKDLSVKIKKLGWYRFQFETTTLFGYKMDDDFDNYDAISQDKNKTYVRYWSDSIRIYRDAVNPSLAWVDPYNITKGEDGKLTQDSVDTIEKMNKEYDELLTKYSAYLPLSDKPDASTSKKITINPNTGLTLPAIFPHDNASTYEQIDITSVRIDQIQDENNQTVSNVNYVFSAEKPNTEKTAFTYDNTKALKISFVSKKEELGEQTNNSVTLLNNNGLYRVRIELNDYLPIFEEEGKGYSSGRANTQYVYLYFYVSDKYNDQKVAPVIDENKVFQVSDVYLWEGHTFDFAKPTFADSYTPTNNLQTDYYLVRVATSGNGKTSGVVSKLDVKSTATRVTVDLDNLYIYDPETDENGTNKWKFESLVSSDFNYFIYAVARNFNAMQAMLPGKLNSADYSISEKVFDTTLFFALNSEGKMKEKTKSEDAGKSEDDDESKDDGYYAGTYIDQIAQYGYAWKRAGFAIHTTSEVSTNPTITVDFATSGNTYVAGEPVHISSIRTVWGSNTKVDGQMSVAVYMVKPNNVLVPVNVVNGPKASAEVVSAVAFNRGTCEVKDWYFTPGVGGDYMIVVTAKANASNQIKTYVRNISIQSSGDWGVTPLSLSTAASNYSVDKTMSLGDTFVLPNFVISDNNIVEETKYFAKNRNLYAYSADGEVTDRVEGNYSITVMGVNDPDCIIGNKFVPNKKGQYVFQYSFALTGSEDKPLRTINYVVQVNDSGSSVSNILMGEGYDDEKVLWNASASGNNTDEDNGVIDGNKYLIDGKSYDLSTDYTAEKPAYAITLSEFVQTNYGASTNFVVDSAALFKYLEPIYEVTGKDDDGNDVKAITGYMYPAIAIPMPNVVSDTASSNEVEITVQKSGSSEYLVSSKKRNAGGNTDTESVIEKIGEYYVFRPEGKFTADCKTTCTAADYMTKGVVSASKVVGLYTVTYKTNNTSLSLNVTFGSLVNGTLDLGKNFLTYKDEKGKTHEIASTTGSNDVVIDKVNNHRYVTIDMSKVTFNDNGNTDMTKMIEAGPHPDKDNEGYAESDLYTAYIWENTYVSVSYEGGSFINNYDWSDDNEDQAIESKPKENGEFLKTFDLTNGSGTYKVTVNMTNKYTGATISNSIEFTIDVNVSNKKNNLKDVWGTILIILSLGLFAGVVYYFVRTARATRFIDTPSAVKEPKNKNKAPKATNAPKDAEAPKKDAE